jgi:hypothetical protein
MLTDEEHVQLLKAVAQDRGLAARAGGHLETCQ